MHHDDSLEVYLANLRTAPQLFSLPCPDCQHVVIGKGENHARALLAIHQEGTCQGAKGVSRDAASDHADVPRLKPPPQE